MSTAHIDKFSTKTLLELGSDKKQNDDRFYVYGLFDPEPEDRESGLFYIGQGCEQRVFAHEKESEKYYENETLNSDNCESYDVKEKEKLRRIKEIKDKNKKVKRVIFHHKLTKDEALKAEAALINAFKYTNNNLSNEVAGHHSIGAKTVEELDRLFSVEPLDLNTVKANVLIIKINKLYQSTMTDEELYDTVRASWNVNSDTANNVDYVFAVYKSLIVGVYKDPQWFKCSDFGKENHNAEEARKFLKKEKNDGKNHERIKARQELIKNYPKPIGLPSREITILEGDNQAQKDKLLKRCFFISNKSEQGLVNKVIESEKIVRSQNPIIYHWGASEKSK